MTQNNWQARYTISRIISAQLAAHDPKRGVMIVSQSGVPHIFAWDVESASLKPITNLPVDFGGISPDGTAIYYHDGESLLKYELATGETHNLTEVIPPFSPVSLSASLNGKVIGFSEVRKIGFSVYTLTNAEPLRLYRSIHPTFGPLFSYDAEYAVVAVTGRKPYGDLSLLAFDLSAYAPQQYVSVLEEHEGSIQPVMFSPIRGDLRLLGMTNATGYMRPLVWDVSTGDRIDIPLEHIEADLTPLTWSSDARQILLMQVEKAIHKLYIYDLNRSPFTPLSNLPEGTIHSAEFLPQSNDEIVLLLETSERPPHVVVVNSRDGAFMRELYTPEAPKGHTWQSVNFTSSGGVSVQAWLAKPDGDGPFPTIIHAPTGPDSVLTPTYDADASAWVDAGFAWLGVNYRGSVTFGEDFHKSIFGMLGLRESDDLSAGAAWLVNQGIAREDALFVSGTRYGASVALMALGRRPDLWAGALVDSPVTDWRALYDSASDTLKAHIRSMFGGTPEEIGVQYRASSPINVVDAVQAPLLIFSQHDDPSVPASQIEDYVSRIRENGGQIEVQWDEGTNTLQRQQIRLDWINQRLKK